LSSRSCLLLKYLADVPIRYFVFTGKFRIVVTIEFLKDSVSTPPMQDYLLYVELRKMNLCSPEFSPDNQGIFDTYGGNKNLIGRMEILWFYIARILFAHLVLLFKMW